MPRLLPVIHVESSYQAMRNIERCVRAHCEGVFLIQMEGQDHLLEEPLYAAKQAWTHLKIGLNHLSLSAKASLEVCDRLQADMMWSDDVGLHSLQGRPQEVAALHTLHQTRRHIEIFASVAFKTQSFEPDPAGRVRLAREHGWIPTVSGKATGHAPDAAWIQALSCEATLGPLAIASGVDPKNAHRFRSWVSDMLVATGISQSFYEIDSQKLQDLQDLLRL